MFVAERFMSDLVKSFGKHPVSTDGEGTWLPNGLSIPEIKTPYTFLLCQKREKHYRDNNAVYQG